MDHSRDGRACCRCGARLARDNPDTLCTPCRRQARDALLGPPAVPAAFWNDERLQQALASRHMGRVIRAWRTHPWHGRGGLAQAVVAAWAGLTQAQLSRIETGPPMVHLDKLIHWARLLRIPPHLLWFTLPEGETQASRRPDALPAADDGAILTDLLRGLTANRPPSLHDQDDAPPVGVSGLSGLPFAASSELLLKLFLQLDDEFGGDCLYQPLSRYVERMAVNVKANPGDGLLAFGELSQLAGWLALDANHHGAARRYFTTAIYVAYEADEPSLAASSLAYLSLQETYRGRRGPALALAQTALAAGTAAPTPLTKTMLSTRLARAHAGLGNATECLHTLDAARTAFAQAGSAEEPLWVCYVDAAEVAAQEGACYLDLGMTDQAREALTRAIRALELSTPHRVRDRVHYLSRLAKCYLREGDAEQACDVATEALALSAAIGSARVTERLKEFCDALEPFGSAPAARRFRELFRHTTARDAG